MRRGVANADTLDELLSSEHGLRTSALALGAGLVRGAGGHCPCAGAVPRHLERELVERIRAGLDPLGEAFCRLRTPAERRPHGAVYTPPAIVRAMGEWAERTGRPDRVVDPGTGSARFLLDAARRFARAELIGFETDRLAALVACANLAAVGAAARARVIVRDYCRARLRHIPGRTLFIGNPPYVRHHELPAAAKEWLAVSAARCGLSASRLASLYVHFFLATWLKAQPGDYGAFITAAEWLDVNYGSLVRRLLLSGLGGGSLTVIDPAAEPFPGTAATAAISTFGIGARPAVMRVSRVPALEHLGRLGCGKAVRRERLQAERRWSRLTGVRHRAPAGYVELGELCRVHRGQVTGCNRIWITDGPCCGLPDVVLFRAVTRAREVIRAGGEIADGCALRRVIDLPADLDRFAADERRRIDAFLRRAREAGAHETYVARARKVWWSLGLRAPAAILATYMARRPPAFAVNTAGVRHLNVAHGLYPREPLDRETQRLLVAYLNACVPRADGRTYAGGLTKFEPREMERIMVPPPSRLAGVVTGPAMGDGKAA